MARTDTPKPASTADCLLCVPGRDDPVILNKIVNKHGDWYMYDLGLMTLNLCLAAHSLGLGTVVVGWYDLEAAERILNCLDDVEVVTLIPMGYRAQKGHGTTHRPVLFLNLCIPIPFNRKKSHVKND